MTVSNSAASLLVALLVAGCGAAGPDDPDPEVAGVTDELTAADELCSKGSFSCDLVMPPEALFANVAPQIDRDRMFMAERPGMRQKHLPMRIQAIAGAGVSAFAPLPARGRRRTARTAGRSRGASL